VAIPKNLGRPLLPFLLCFAPGCHSYVEVPSPVLGMTVRVTLHETQAFSDPDEKPKPITFEGRLLAQGPLLLIERADLQEVDVDDLGSTVVRDTLTLPRETVRVVEVRRLSWMKSSVGGFGFLLVARVAYGLMKPPDL
jgi:hypothetical protein